MIVVENLSFDYPGKHALDQVTFSLPERSITALVGPNGAGKTTLLRCLAGLQSLFHGRVLLDGLDIQQFTRECHTRIGYLADEFGLYDQLTVARCLTFSALTHGVPEEQVAQRMIETATWLGLDDRLQQRAGQLSRGLRQRLAIGQAVIYHPTVLILDEPASGLDPEARIRLARLFLELRDRGMTLIVSSHILAELEAYSTHMLLLDQGKMLEFRSLTGRIATGGKVLRVRLTTPHPDLAAILTDRPGINDVSLNGVEADFAFHGDDHDARQLLREMIDIHLPVCAFHEVKSDLQGAYLARLTEQRQENATP